jgi:hypothetical protein
MQELAEAQKHTDQEMKELSAAADERMRGLDTRQNTLIITVDGVIRNRPNP